MNFETITKIQSWYEIDQFVRNRIEDQCQKKLMSEIDSINTFNLIELIKKGLKSK